MAIKLRVRKLSLPTPEATTWNKSNREHNTIGSEPASVRAAAEAAVKAPLSNRLRSSALTSDRKTPSPRLHPRRPGC